MSKNQYPNFLDLLESELRYIKGKLVAPNTYNNDFDYGLSYHVDLAVRHLANIKKYVEQSTFLEAAMQSQLASRDALIERLVEAGDAISNLMMDGTWDSAELEEWQATVAEYLTIKAKESVE